MISSYSFGARLRRRHCSTSSARPECELSHPPDRGISRWTLFLIHPSCDGFFGVGERMDSQRPEPVEPDLCLPRETAFTIAFRKNVFVGTRIPGSLPGNATVGQVKTLIPSGGTGFFMTVWFWLGNDRRAVAPPTAGHPTVRPFGENAMIIYGPRALSIPRANVSTGTGSLPFYSRSSRRRSISWTAFRKRARALPLWSFGGSPRL